MVLNIQGNLTEPTTTIGRFGLEEKDPTIDIGLPEDLYEKVENYVNPEETDVSQQTDKILKPKPRPPNLNTIPNIKPKLRPGSVSPIEKVAELNYLLRGKIDPKSRLSKILSGLNELTEEGQRAIKGFMDNAVGGETDFDPTKDAWCAAFVAHILSELGADPLKSKNRYDRLRADKYKEYGSAVENFADAREGDIVVFDLFGNDGVGDHVAFYAGGRITDKSPIDSAYINVVGGNQGVGEVSLNENVYTKDKVLAIRRITYNDIDFEFTQEMAERDLVFKKFIPTDASDLIKKGERFSLDKGGMPEQMNMFGYTAEGVQQEVDKFVDKDAAPAKDITFKDAAKFVAELTPIIGDAMAAKEVYDELQKEDPNYFLAGALGGAAIIGLIPGIGDAAASAIRAGARKAFDVGKRVEVDPDAVGMMGGNIRLKSKKTLDDFGYIEDNPVTKGIGKPAEDWLSENIEQANKSKNLLDGATTAFLGTSKDKPLFLDTDLVSSLKGARDEVRKKGDPQYDRLKETVDKEGFDPNQTILIEVNHKGEAYIIEGNTRAALAKELDVPNIKAEIRYKNGAELVDSPFSPQNILEKSSTGSYQDLLAISKKLDEEMDIAGNPQLENSEYKQKMSNFDVEDDVIKWKENVKDFIKKSRDVDPVVRTPELEDAAQKLIDKKITRQEYLEVVDKHKPVTGWNQLPREPSTKAMVYSLKPNQVERGSFVLSAEEASKLGVKKSNLSIGDFFDGRLDVTAYKEFDTWIVAGSKQGESGQIYAKAIHYEGGKGKPVILLNSDNPKKYEGNILKGKRIGSAQKNPKGDIYGKTPYAAISGYVKDLDVDNIREVAKNLLDDPEWVQLGFDPRRQGNFYVRKQKENAPLHAVATSAEEVIQIGPMVLAKNPVLDLNYEGYNEGGMTMNDQMEMAFMQEGGIADDGMDVDPVSGNEVPPGSLAEEVRDDIPAQLSEGEYVVPADVVRYYGVKFFEDLRDEAKRGLAQMEADGRIGGEPVPDGGPVNDKELSEQEMAAIREVMGMAEGGEVQNPYLQQQQLYSQPRPAPIDEKRNTTITNVNPVENQMPMQSMASGGQVQGYQGGGAETTTTPSYAQNIFSPGTFPLGFSFMGQPQQTTMISSPTTSTTPTTPGGTTVITPVTGEKPTLTLYGPEGQIRTFILPLSEEDKKTVADLREAGYSETQTVTPVEKETKPETKTETKDPVSSDSMKKVFGKEKKNEPVNFKDEKSIKDAIGDYHSSGPLKGALLAGAINPGVGILTYFAGSKSQDKQKDYLLKGIDERLSSPLDPPEKVRLEKLRQELLDKDTYEASINKKSKELGLFDGFLDKVKGSLTNEDIKVVKAKYNNSSKNASDAWQNATKLKNSLHPSDDPIAYHKAIKAQSEASRAFTALKREEVAREKDPSTVDPEAI